MEEFERDKNWIYKYSWNDEVGRGSLFGDKKFVLLL